MRVSETERFVGVAAMASALFGGAAAYAADRRFKARVEAAKADNAEGGKNVGF